jgi:hypothetical protein
MRKRKTIIPNNRSLHQYHDKIRALLSDADTALIKKEFLKIEKINGKISQICKKYKKSSILEENEEAANHSCILQINSDLIFYVSQFYKTGYSYQFSASWGNLQDSLDCCDFLIRTCKKEESEHFEKIRLYLSSFERLYPFLFVSPGQTIKLICSICGKEPLDEDCPHIPGNLYWGEIAGYNVTEIVNVDHVAIIPHPKDKRCVICIDDNDQKFNNLRELFDNTPRPFTPLHIQINKIIRKNSDLASHERMGICPCQSGLMYDDCCKDKEILEIPHYNYQFGDFNELISYEII